MLSLEKVLEKGSLRWIGQNYEGLFPEKTVIAGKSIKAISKAINLPCYTFGRCKKENVFIAHDSDKIFYVFVNPKYHGYRKAFQNAAGRIPSGFHVDHTLSRNLANHLGYQYVLLCMIPQNVNSSHGRFEKIKIELPNSVPEVCYSDDRIYNKILSRYATSRQTKNQLLNGYTPEASPSHGLTLKQKGLWNSSFGFDIMDMQSLLKKTFPL
jgi:hypothetical protein